VHAANRADEIWEALHNAGTRRKAVAIRESAVQLIWLAQNDPGERVQLARGRAALKRSFLRPAREAILATARFAAAARARRFEVGGGSSRLRQFD
jgi:hypothetical protein